MFRSLLLGMSLSVVVSLSAVAGEALDQYRLIDGHLAIDGYSPVSYFQRGKAEKGSEEFAVEHEGITYWLTDAEQVALFTENPERYQPAHGGWCSLMLSGSGARTPANPESWHIVDDRLLLFWAGEFNGMEISGRRNWSSKTNDEIKQERKRVADADKVWSGILSGKKPQPINLFNKADHDRLSPHHWEDVAEDRSK